MKFNDDGQVITYQYPTNKLGGMLWGERSLNIEGTMIFEDNTNGIKAVIFFGVNKKIPDEFIGKLYKYDPTSSKNL